MTTVARNDAPKETFFSFGDLYRSGKNNFNLLRLGLALLVVFSHCFSILQAPPHEMEPLSLLTQQHFTLGTLALDAFFVISGFLIAASWEHSKNALDFARRRVLRVYPGFFVCLLFCVFAVGPLSNGNAVSYFAQLQTQSLTSFFRLQNLPGVFVHNVLPHAVNGSLWTIRCEVQCYALLALLGLITKLRRHAVLLAFVSCYLVYNVGVPFYQSHFGPLDGELMPRLTTYFFAGAAFWAYHDNIPCLSPRLVFAAVLVFVVGLFFLPHWLVPLGGTYCLMGAAFSRRLRAYNFGKRFDLSYGVYLYAFPIQQLLAQFFFAHLNPLTLFAAALPLLFFAAWCSWTFVEKPFLRLKSKKRPDVSTP